ncbi:MAG: xanthine dehydrogenase family protein subunit M [Thermomicrobiales bacterium]
MLDNPKQMAKVASTAACVIRPTGLPRLELTSHANINDILVDLADGAYPMAGGTDVLLWARKRGNPRRLAWIGRVGPLHDFSCTGDPIVVGAAVTLSRIVRSAAFSAAVPAVAEGAHAIGSVQIRNQATLVGNICTASPAGDTLPGLLVYDACVDVCTRSGSYRQVALKDFLVGPGRTELESGEFVSAVSMSRALPGEASAFVRFTQRRALDLSVASVAVRIGLEVDGITVRMARVALGGVATKALLVDEAAALLIGRSVSSAALRDCADAAAEVSSPITDHRSSADYRRHLVRVLVQDAVKIAVRRAQGVAIYD